MNTSACHITHFPNFLSLLDLSNHSTKSHISIVFSNKNSNLNGKKLSIIHTKNLSTNNDASTKFSNYVNVNKTVNYVNSNNTSSEFFDYLFQKHIYVYLSFIFVEILVDRDN